MGTIANILKNMARKIYNNDKKVGDLTQLTTSDKTNIVAAINALATDIGGRENLDATRVEQIAKAELAKLTDGASAAFDTLAEIEAELGKGSGQLAALLTEIGLAKTELEKVKNDFNALKAYVGFDEKDTLEPEVTRLMNTGR